MHYEVKNGLSIEMGINTVTGEPHVMVQADNGTHTTLHLLEPASGRQIGEALLHSAELCERAQRFRDSLGWEDGQTDKDLILGATQRFIVNLSQQGDYGSPVPIPDVRVRASLGAEKSGANGGKGGAR